MDYNLLLPAPFHGNIYVYREKLSDNLTKLVKARRDIHKAFYSIQYLKELDFLICKEHNAFVHICRTIDTLESDCERFGSPFSSLNHLQDFGIE